jgi:hypothetical protein
MVYQNSRNGFVKSLDNSFMNSANVKQHVQHKQQLNKRNQNQRSLRGQDFAAFNEAVRELCSMYDAVNYYGNAEYAKKNGWRVINKEQLNTATIYAIRYAPVVPKRSYSKKQQNRQQNQSQQQYRKQQQQQQPRQQNNRRQQSGKRIGGCPYRPNVPRVYNYNTTPLPNDLYPSVNNFNHLYDAFNYFGNSQVRNIKSWIESSRTHKLNSIASVFAKRNAPYVPARPNRSNKRNQQQYQKRQQQQNVPKQQSNRRQNNNKKQKKQMINQEPLSNVWEDYYIVPNQRIFK